MIFVGVDTSPAANYSFAMSLPELERALAKHPRRSRKTSSRTPRASGAALAAACLAANRDTALVQEIISWQAFDDSSTRP
jgi:hypothetical protein